MNLKCFGMIVGLSCPRIIRKWDLLSKSCRSLMVLENYHISPL